MEQPGSSIDPAAEEAQAIAALFTPQTATTNFLMNLSAVLRIVMGWWTLTLEVFIRRDFGERYFTITRVFLAGLLLAGYIIWGGSWLRLLFQVQGDFFILLVLPAFLLMVIYHFRRIRQRQKGGIQWHSMSFGISRLEQYTRNRQAYNDWIFYRFVEPFTGFAIALVLWILSLHATAFWIATASVCMFFRNNMLYFQERARILDIVDARIEAKYFHAISRNQPKSETAGYSIAAQPYDNFIPPDTGSDFAQTVRESIAPPASTAEGSAKVEAQTHQTDDYLDENVSPFKDTLSDTLEPPDDK